MMPVTLTAVRLPRQPCEGLSQLVALVLFPNTQPLPHLLAGKHEPNCPKEWVPFLGFSGDMVEDLSQDLKVLGHLQVS